MEPPRNEETTAAAGHTPIPQHDEELGELLLDAAFRVHTALGPGLLESVYARCLAIELQRSGVRFDAEKTLPIAYHDVLVESGLRLDLLVGDRVVVELKAVDELAPIHMAQLYTYLKLANLRLGFLINFNVRYLKDGIKRVVR